MEKVLGGGCVQVSELQPTRVNSKESGQNTKDSVRSHTKASWNQTPEPNTHHCNKSASNYIQYLRARLGSNDSCFLKTTGAEMKMKC